MKNLNQEIINEELKYYYGQNKVDIIHEFRITYPYNIMINEKDIGTYHFYINQNKKYLFIASKEKLDLYFLETYIKVYNIYGIKYYDIKFEGNTILKINVLKI